MKAQARENIYKLLKVITGVVILMLAIRWFFPEKINPTLDMSGRYAREMISIFPAVLLIMGLADVWVPSKLVKKYLGQEAGIRGKLLAIFLGTLPTGPMYVAFPLAAELLRKKASLSNIVIFLGIWASLKIPQIGVEIKFLGLKFAALRFVFTLISVIFIGLIVEKLVDREEIPQAQE
ncbi:MAG: permease [Bacillota bacterium]